MQEHPIVIDQRELTVAVADAAVDQQATLMQSRRNISGTLHDACIAAASEP